MRYVHVTPNEAMFLLRKRGWPVFCVHKGTLYCYEQDGCGGDVVNAAHYDDDQGYVKDDLLAAVFREMGSG